MSTEQSTKDKATIRPMEPKDIDAIFEIDRALTGQERAITHTELITGDLGGVLDLSFVADVSGQVVGFVLARHAYVGEPVVEAGLIEGLGTYPVYQRQGIATNLVNALTERSQSKGIKTLRVMLSERDSQMEGFFARMNFHRAQLIVYDKTL